MEGSTNKPMNQPHSAEDHESFASRTTTDPAKARQLAIDAARLLADDKCEDVLVLDVTQISQITDFIVIGTGTSDRQMKSVLDHVRDMAKDADYELFRSSTDDNAVWLLADFVDMIVHLFEPNARAHYDLETLWNEASRVHWQRPGEQTSRDHAGLGQDSDPT